MKEKKLFDAMTELDDELIEEARTTRLLKQSGSWKRWTAIAASIALVFMAGGSTLLRLGLCSPGAGSGGGGGHEEGSVFMSYAGPVMPLTLTEEVDNLSVERRIDFDFSPYTPRTEEYTPKDGETKTYVRYDNEVIVTDGYLMTNESEKDVMISAIYPFVGALQDTVAIVPEVTIDGTRSRAKINAGPYTGGFEGAYGGDDPDGGSYNLAYIESWEGYKALLSDGEYMERAFDAFPELNQKVIVYEFTGIMANHEEADNPTLNVEFEMDYNETRIFTYGFNGGSNNMGSNECARHFSVPETFNPDFGMIRYLIVMGEDISEYTLQGYKNGGCEQGEELDSVTVSVKRYETTLGDAVWLAMEEDRKVYSDDVTDNLIDLVSDEVQYGLAAELLLDYGALSMDSKARYDAGLLEDIFSESKSMNRVLYLAFDLTIPAGESVTVMTKMIKESSYDYYGSGSGNQNVYGYDMVTSLGSNLVFKEQRASIQDRGLIEIVHQNFGFDLENEVKDVELDLDIEYYYLEISLKQDQ